jgi:hypothetical protein
LPRNAHQLPIKGKLFVSRPIGVCIAIAAHLAKLAVDNCDMARFRYRMPAANRARCAFEPDSRAFGARCQRWRIVLGTRAMALVFGSAVFVQPPGNLSIWKPCTNTAPLWSRITASLLPVAGRNTRPICR